MSVSLANGAVHGQSALLQMSLQANGVQGSPPIAQRLRVTDLHTALIGKIYTFLDLGDVIAGKKTCKAFQRSYRLWEKQTGTLDVERRGRYLSRNKEVNNKRNKGAVDPALVQEMQKAARSMEKLQLTSYRLEELEYFFCSPGQKEDTFRLFDAHSLEIDLFFSTRVGRRPIKTSRNPMLQSSPTNERVNALIERICFHCSKVRHLRLDNPSEDACQSLLKGLTNLTSLEVEHFKSIDYTTLPTFCPKLQRLSIKSADDQVVQQADTLPALWKLEVTGATDVGLAALAKHPTLREIKIGGCRDVTNKGLAHLATIPNLEKVTFGNCDNVDDLTPLARIQNLRCLHLLAIYRQPSFPKMIASLSGSQIEDLSISYMCDYFNDSCLESIGKMSRLRSLRLEKPAASSLLTNKGLQALSGCKDLQCFTIAATKKDDGAQWQFTTAGLIALVETLPELLELNLRDCMLSNVDADKIEEFFYKTRPSLLVVKRDKVEKKEERKED